MRYAVLIEQGPTSFGASVPDLPGCIAVAKTREEVERLIESAIAEHIALLKSEGYSVPEPVTLATNVEVKASAS
jgi:predicted RNase H-like HicB family nuclease